MDVSEIITWADRKYPNEETTANKIIDLNLLHKEIYMKLKKLKHEYTEDTSDVTVEDQLEYTLPSDCSIDNIIMLEVETGDGTGEYDEYIYAGLRDTLTSGNFYRYSPSGKYLLTSYGEEISYDDGTIRIRYFKTPSEITASDDTPDLDSDYHILLCYALVQSLASQGHNPDTQMADYYQLKFDEYLKAVEYDLSDKFNSSPLGYVQVREWF